MMAIPITPPGDQTGSPTARRSAGAWAPVTARARVLNWVWRRRAQGAGSLGGGFLGQLRAGGEGGIFSLAVFTRNLERKKDSVMMKSLQ